MIAAAPRGPRLWWLRARRGEGEPALRCRARGYGPRDGSGYVSRSYSFPLAVIAVHDGPVGIDIECVAPCDREFAASICTPAELAAAPADDDAIIDLWSAKEALAKALGDARVYDPRRLGSPSRWPGRASGPWRARPLEMPAGYRGWVCWSM